MALSPFWRRAFRLPIHLYHWGGGGLLGRRFMLLIHIGRRSGLRRETVLEVMEYRPTGPEIVVMSGFGRDSDWLKNIETRTGEEVVIGRDRFAATHRLLAVDEAVSVVRRYEHRNRLISPIVRFALTRLAGWRYHGSDSDRRRLAAQFPFIAFRPQT